MCGWESVIIKRTDKWFDGLTVCLINGIILGSQTMAVEAVLEIALKTALGTALVYGDSFLDNGRPDDSNRNGHAIMVSVPGQKGFLV